MQFSAMSEIQVAQRCLECGKMEVYSTVAHHNARVKHDGSVYTLSISDLHVLKCRSCGDVLFDDTTDDQISQALREHLGLLPPQEIRERLRMLGLTQKEFSEQSSIAAETVSRWLSGAYIQSRAYDKLMRLFFEREERKLQIPKTARVTIRDGELSPWHYPMPYQFAPVDAEMLLESGETLISEGDLALAA